MKLVSKDAHGHGDHENPKIFGVRRVGFRENERLMKYIILIFFEKHMMAVIGS